MISRYTMAVQDLKKSFYSTVVMAMSLFLFNKSEAQCPLICNKNVNVSMEGTCLVEITPAMIVEGFAPNPSCNYTVVVMGSNGLPLPTSPFINSSHVGRSFDVKISYDHNSCWGKINVEDKFGPTIVCPPADTISCYDRRTFPLPNVTDNCGTVKSVRVVSDDLEDLGCSQTYAAIRRISYIAFDNYDNRSAVCTRVVYYKKITLDSIDFPKDRDDVAAHSLSCDNKENWDKNYNKYPEPSESGVPTNKVGIPVYPDVAYCDLKVTFADSELPICGKSKKIFRAWTILDWCTREVRNKIQVIKISDHDAPEATVNHVDSLKVNSNPYDCWADWTVPAPRNFIDCSDSLWSVGYVVADQFGEFPANPFYTEENVVKVGNTITIRRLPVGKVKIRYRLFDSCGNFRFKFVEIEVVDKIAPDVVCNEFIIVTIGSESDVNIPAAALDNGSRDRCSKVSFTALRMNLNCGTPTSWSDFFKVCCSDVGTDMMVSLRVTDQSGNSNTCMVTVRVQDKRFPKVTCPPDVTIDCGINPDTFRITGMATATDNCANPKIFKKDSLALNHCGIGMIFRKWYAEDNNRNRDSCIQKITINPLPRLTLSDTIWRRVRDTMIEACMESPDIDPRITGQPGLPSDKCRQLAANYKDQVFYKVDGVCGKILRQWTVVDWCDPLTTSTNNQNRLIYTQVIKIINTKAPQIMDCRDTTFCIDGSCNGFINYSLSATDLCTPANKLEWSYQIDLNSDGTIDRTGSTNNASGTYPTGKHKIFWKVKDGCGNEAKCDRILTVKDCKKPTPYCLGEITTVIMPGAGMVSIWAKDFDLGSSDNCGGKVKISFSVDLKDTVRTFNCTQLGQRELQMWVTDTTGNQDFCVVKINIQDGNNNCGQASGSLVSGKVMKENLKGLEESEVTLTNMVNNQNEMAMSDQTGSFSFKTKSDGNYKVQPVYKKEHILGINTIDLVHLQKHILGSARFNSPYKLIAADADGDGRVSISDIVELRKLILGIKNGFDKHEQAWRFIPEGYKFQNPLNPWPLREHVELIVKNGNVAGNAQFMAVKVGDLDGSSLALTSRSNSKLLVHHATNFKFDRTCYITLSLKDKTEIEAMQLEMQLNVNNVRNLKVNVGKVELEEENYFFDPLTGKLRLSWTALKELSLNSNDALISLQFDGNVKEPDQDNFAINEDYSFVYTKSGDVKGISLEERSHQKFDVLQNEPNPFDNYSRIRINLPEDGKVRMNIYNLAGKLIYQTDQLYKSGTNDIQLSKDQIKEKGVMLYEVEFKGAKITRKMLIM